MDTDEMNDLYHDCVRAAEAEVQKLIAVVEALSDLMKRLDERVTELEMCRPHYAVLVDNEPKQKENLMGQRTIATCDLYGTIRGVETYRLEISKIDADGREKLMADVPRDLSPRALAVLSRVVGEAIPPVLDTPDSDPAAD